LPVKNWQKPNTKLVLTLAGDHTIKHYTTTRQTAATAAPAAGLLLSVKIHDASEKKHT
jgi:hypothetical protein